MTRTVSALIISFVFFATVVAEAETFSRSISLSWEEIPDSSGYELELSRIIDKDRKSKPLIFKPKTNRWKGKIRPGQYSMRIRSIDDRGVPGEWNEPSTIIVRLPAPTPLEPKNKASITSTQADKHEVHFQWSPVPGAKSYRVEILAEDGSPVHSTEVTSSSLRHSLPVAKSYKWSVTPVSEDDIPGDPLSEPVNFTLVGKPVDSPVVEKPESRFANQVKWSKPQHAETFDYVLSRKDKDGRWRVVERKSGVKDNFKIGRASCRERV